MRFFALNRIGPPARRRVLLAVGLFVIGDLLWIGAKFPHGTRHLVTTPEALSREGLPVLVLGASVQADREPSPVLTKRLQVALDLFRQGKAGWFLVSGDNRSPFYNEPQAMRRWLQKQGVPATAIVNDYAGRRTWDSLRRAQAVFGLRRLLIVTSDFHLPRALFIAEALGMDAQGVPASTAEHSLWARVGFWNREYAACHKAVWDSWFPPDTRLGPREPTPEDWRHQPAGKKP